MAEAIAAASEGHARVAPATSLTELAALLASRRDCVRQQRHWPLAPGRCCRYPLCRAVWPDAQAEPQRPLRHWGHVAIAQRSCLEGSSRSRRTAGPESMLAISVEDVARACDQILGRRVKARLNGVATDLHEIVIAGSFEILGRRSVDSIYAALAQRDPVLGHLLRSVQIRVHRRVVVHLQLPVQRVQAASGRSLISASSSS